MMYVEESEIREMAAMVLIKKLPNGNKRKRVGSSYDERNMGKILAARYRAMVFRRTSSAGKWYFL